ncbi:MAG: isoprenylcysteine carboxylmethyltransferase family protein [Planctomycetota bacterium]|nr:isoprenylcysteine carboxylmethyltransferase family protein [Planctomycetota bacterium]
MEVHGFLKRHGIVRSAIRADIVLFAIPGMTVLVLGLYFCTKAGLSGFWRIAWHLLTHPQEMSHLPPHRIVGLALFFLGLAVATIGQITLWKNYSGTVVIREDHQLVTHGLYRFTRNPMYLGVISALIGLPMFASSLHGVLTMSVLVPIFLVRIRLEEKLLTEEFQEQYQEYKSTTKRLIPFLF